MMFMGYRRACGRAGTRNLVAVIPTVFCANFVARRIAESVRGACVFPHPVGCGYPGPDQRLTAHVLRRLAAHPNFGAVLLVGLGCAPIYPSIIHSTPNHFGAERSQAVIGIQMASAYVGNLLMPPLFGLIANNVTPALFPVYLLCLLALMVLMHEQLIRRTAHSK